MNLSERKLKILENIVDNYISTGSPVGSKSLCENLGVSSSTIRSDMAELTSLGLLEQPYTSSGRVPSKEGYRIYVNRLLKNEKQRQEEQINIRMCSISDGVYDPDEILTEALDIISNLTKCVAISIAPSKNDIKIRDIQLIFVKQRLIMIVLITSDGNVENKLLFLERGCSQEEIFYISKILRNKLLGLELSKINSSVFATLSENLQSVLPSFSKILSSVANLAKKASCVSVSLKGEANLFLHEDLDKVSVASAVDLFNSPLAILDLLENNPNGSEINVLIGKEGDALNLENFSIVASRYAGASILALVGPTRMDYAKIISNIKSLVFILNNFLNLEV